MPFSLNSKACSVSLHSFMIHLSRTFFDWRCILALPASFDVLLEAFYSVSKHVHFVLATVIGQTFVQVIQIRFSSYLVIFMFLVSI